MFLSYLAAACFFQDGTLFQKTVLTCMLATYFSCLPFFFFFSFFLLSQDGRTFDVWNKNYELGMHTTIYRERERGGGEIKLRMNSKYVCVLNQERKSFLPVDEEPFKNEKFPYRLKHFKRIFIQVFKKLFSRKLPRKWCIINSTTCYICKMIIKLEFNFWREKLGENNYTRWCFIYFFFLR